MIFSAATSKHFTADGVVQCTKDGEYYVEGNVHGKVDNLEVSPFACTMFSVFVVRSSAEGKTQVPGGNVEPYVGRGGKAVKIADVLSS